MVAAFRSSLLYSQRDNDDFCGRESFAEASSADGLPKIAEDEAGRRIHR